MPVKKHVIINLPYEDSKGLFDLFDAMAHSIDKILAHNSNFDNKQLKHILKMKRFCSKVRNQILDGLVKYND